MDFALPEIDTSSAETGVPIPLTTIEGTPLLNAKKEPVTLTLIGADSSKYRKVARKQARERIEINRKKKDQDSVIDEEAMDKLDQHDIELLVSCTVGWEGVLDSKKKPVEFTAEACEYFYKHFPIAAEQANRAIVDRSHFIKAS